MRMKNEMGGIVREARKKKGWTQDVLGKKAGCTGSHITNIEKGRHVPQHLLESLCRALDLDVRLMQRLNDMEFLRKQLGKVNDVQLKEKIYNAMAEEAGGQPRAHIIDDHCVMEDSEEYHKVKTLLDDPERYMVLEDDRERRILAEFRQMDEGRKEMAIELIVMMPKKSKK